jgi:hypothetical protein
MLPHHFIAQSEDKEKKLGVLTEEGISIQHIMELPGRNQTATAVISPF